MKIPLCENRKSQDAHPSNNFPGDGGRGGPVTGHRSKLATAVARRPFHRFFHYSLRSADVRRSDDDFPRPLAVRDEELEIGELCDYVRHWGRGLASRVAMR